MLHEPDFLLMLLHYSLVALMVLLPVAVVWYAWRRMNVEPECYGSRPDDWMQSQWNCDECKFREKCLKK